MAEQWTVKAVDGVDVNAPKGEESIAKADERLSGAPIPENEVLKVNLDQPPKAVEDEQQVSDEKQEEPAPVSEGESPENVESPIELVQEPSAEESVVEPTAATVDAIQEAAADPRVDLPENIDKLVKFMEETGGSVEDYVSLNKDLSDYNDQDLIREYYRQSKPTWDTEDINDHMNDQFGYDEEVDEAKDVRARKRAMKDELYNAKKYLEGNKEKYYADLVSRKQTDIPQEYREAYDFHSSYKDTLNSNEQLTSTFKQRTAEVFNDDFKGFDFNVGDNTYRYKVNDSAKVKEYQSDINNFVGEFLAEDGTIGDAKGYHKAMYAAKNVDKIAKHFYEQGRAEALKESAKNAKNINMDPRKDQSADVTSKTGVKARIVNGEFDGGLRFKNYRNK